MIIPMVERGKGTVIVCTDRSDKQYGHCEMDRHKFDLGNTLVDGTHSFGKFYTRDFGICKLNTQGN